MSDIVVERARLYQVALPLREPFCISGGTLSVRQSLIVELEDREGRRGYGEAAPFETPFYSAETVASARALLEEVLLPRIVGGRFSKADDVHATLAPGIIGNRMARAGVETAWWDLRAACDDANLADLVSRRLAELLVPPAWLVRSPRIECGIALGIPESRSLEELGEWVGRALDRGYRRIKLKVRPGWDVEPCAMVADIIRRRGAAPPLTVDANGAYTLAEHETDLRDLDRLDLLYIEQPLSGEALWDTCLLAAVLETPICLDESVTSDEVARQILAMGGPRIWNVKIQRVGGLEEACRIYARAAATGVELWAGTMPETGLGAQAMLALGCHAGFVYPSDLEPSDRWYVPGTDVIELEMDAEGCMRVPGRPGGARFGRHSRACWGGGGVGVRC